MEGSRCGTCLRELQTSFLCTSLNASTASPTTAGTGIMLSTPRGEVKIHKDKQGLPYINLDKSDQEAAVLLIQMMEKQDEENKDGTEKEVTLV